MTKAYIVETLPFDDIKDYKWYLIVDHAGGERVTYFIAPTDDKPKQLRKMTNTFEIVIDDTEDVAD